MNQLRIGSWNVRSFNGKDQEIIEELVEHKIDICSISETKKKGKGTTDYGEYILAYSGKQKDVRAASGVGLLIKQTIAHNIMDIDYRSDRIIVMKIKLAKDVLHIISVYAPDMGRPQQEAHEFYDQLQQTIDRVPKQSSIIILGDFNARIGDAIIPGIKNRFNEANMNDRGEMLIDFCTHNELRINNTFFEHKKQHKVTFCGSKTNSIIDYIITNRNIRPEQIIDVRALTSANIGSDHNLILGKITMMKPTSKKHSQVANQEKFNIESFRNQSTIDLYQRRLKQHIDNNTIMHSESSDSMWEKIKSNIINAAEEAIGKRILKTSNNRKNGKPWFTPEIKELAQEKKKAHLQYKSSKTPRDYIQYVEIRNRANNRIRQIKREYWEDFSREMENDMYGSQKRIWKILRASKMEVNEAVQTDKISLKAWTDHFRTLYSSIDTLSEAETIPKHNNETPLNTDGLEELTSEKILEEMKKLKNGKSPGPDNISNELLKHGGEILAGQLAELYNNIIENITIPSSWRESTTIPLHKKGSLCNPENYRGITLLNSSLKLFTKLLSQHIDNKIEISEEQQGFRKNRSTVDAIFIIRQIAEKSIEYNKPAFLCFIDLTKAFDRARITDVVKELQRHNIHTNIIETIVQLNSNNTTVIKTKTQKSDTLEVKAGIRQGDSLSPLLFNLLMDNIIEEVRKVNHGYSMGRRKVKIVSYADDVVLLAETEDGLQRLTQTFNTAAEKVNMKISINKTKTMTIAKEPRRCKIVINGEIIEQVPEFSYLGTTISAYGNLNNIVRQQVNKASRIAGALRHTIWKNKHIATVTKTRIYKACVRPLLTYAGEARAETSVTKQMYRTHEMKVLRTITGNTLLDHRKSSDIREECDTMDVVRWVRERRRGWNEHVTRMDNNRLAKIVRNGRPLSRRMPGRPPKRWKECWTSTSQEAARNG